MTVCRTTKQSTAHCQCSRCKPHQEVRYGFVAKEKKKHG